MRLMGKQVGAGRDHDRGGKKLEKIVKQSLGLKKQTRNRLKNFEAQSQRQLKWGNHSVYAVTVKES